MLPCRRPGLSATLEEPRMWICSSVATGLCLRGLAFVNNDGKTPFPQNWMEPLFATFRKLHILDALFFFFRDLVRLGPLLKSTVAHRKRFNRRLVRARAGAGRLGIYLLISLLALFLCFRRRISKWPWVRDGAARVQHQFESVHT